MVNPVLPQSVDLLAPGHDMSPDDVVALENAWQRLEIMPFAARLTAIVGKRMDDASLLIPERIRDVARKATTKALETAMQTALKSLDHDAREASARLHQAMAVASGAAGGAFGLISLPVELPLSTLILLRSIADIARAEGEDLSQPEAVLACIEVFALGSHAKEDDFLSSSYFAMRALLARSISEAAQYVAANATASQSAPVILRFLSQIAGRFGIAVTQKALAQAIPLLGAAGGAAINYAFIHHFQSLATGHFTIRRLERKYGADLIRERYNSIHLVDRKT
jgi:hypothetical protein